MMKTKIIAMYLPQFHRIPENDEFWGEGFTDWVTVKNAKPLYKDHIQPRVPLNNNYYDLSVEENVVWQADLAVKYGIYGFGVYHYWFNNEKNLLTKPAEIMRDSQDLHVKYFLVWDNASWKRSWSNLEGNDWAPLADKAGNHTAGPQILIPYILGKEADWRRHYDELLTHFKSPNYIKKDNKPIFSILCSEGDIMDMCNSWDKWAKEDGFDGMFFIFKSTSNLPDNVYRYNYEPHTSGWGNKTFFERLEDVAFRCLKYRKRMYYDYDLAWKRLLKHAASERNEYLYHGAFVSYDDSPRRGAEKSKIVRGASPKKFRKYFKQLLSISDEQGKDYVFLTAWNEWGEGAFLEPDVIEGFGYLEAIKDCLL